MKINLEMRKRYIAEASSEIEAYTIARKELKKMLKKAPVNLEIDEIVMHRCEDFGEEYKQVEMGAKFNITIMENIGIGYIEEIKNKYFPTAEILHFRRAVKA